MEAKLLFVHALSPLHAGTGQGIGLIDLPVAREKATNLPYLPGSSLKGSLRSACEPADLRTRIFGPEPGKAGEYASAVQVSDQRLLLLPVRSLAGTFAWITSPLVLHRLVRDATNVGLTSLPDVPAVAQTAGLVATKNCALHTGDQAIFLEDLNLKAQPEAVVDDWAGWLGSYLFADQPNWQEMLKERLCIVSNDILGFLLDTATEVTARIHLNENEKTAEKGGLWYEESLPAETVLSGLVVAVPTQIKSQNSTTTIVKPDEVFSVMHTLTGTPLQLGGNATVGHGLCQVQMS